jgi:hypothetical protein
MKLEPKTTTSTPMRILIDIGLASGGTLGPKRPRYPAGVIVAVQPKVASARGNIILVDNRPGDNVVIACRNKPCLRYICR